MYILILVIKLYIFLFIFWVMYAATMNFVGAIKKEKRGGKKISKAAKFLGYQLIAIFIPLDWLLNRTIFVIIFFELWKTKRELVTNRLKRYHIEQPNMWRGKLAAFVCDSLLDFLDIKEDHC